jgi:isopropylmalate/homocitrate/citramalate synthase
LGKRREILIGKKSGKSSIEYKLKEMGVSASPEEVEKILEGVKALANQKKGLVSQKELVKIIRNVKTSFTKEKEQR